MRAADLRDAFEKTKFGATPFRPTRADWRRWSAVLNYIVFDGKIPPYRKITVRRLRGTYAYFISHETSQGRKYGELHMTPRFLSFQSFLSVLAHELCHYAEWMSLETTRHGAFFYSHREILALLGIRLARSYPNQQTLGYQVGERLPY